MSQEAYPDDMPSNSEDYEEEEYIEVEEEIIDEPAVVAAQESSPSKSNNSKSKSKSKRKRKHKRKRRKRAEPAGTHGSEIDMVAVKEYYQEKVRAARAAAKLKAASFAMEEESTKTPSSDRYGAGGSKASKRDFLDDPLAEMTRGRRLALKLMQKKWYNPAAGVDSDDEASSANVNYKYSADLYKSGRYNKSDYYMADSFDQDEDTDDNEDDEDDEETEEDDHLTGYFTNYEKPSLAKAWAYFEHKTLRRYFIENSDDEEDEEDLSLNAGCCKRFHAGFVKADRQLTLAEPGATGIKTRLYDPISTPHKQLGAFGQGVALYFTSLRAIGLLTFLAGIVNIYSMYYFASDNYVTNGSGGDLPWLQQGSAICTDTSWVPCPDCDCSPENNPEKFEAQKEWENGRCVRIPRESFNLTTGSEAGDEFLTFALKNNCDGAVWEVALCNYIALFMVFIGIMVIGIYLDRAQVEFDEGEQTAQDYSISIKNPPPDAGDPEEWRNFFQEQCDGAQVAVCTCALDNDLLVRALVERRETYRKIRNSLPPGHPMDTLSIACVAAEIERQRSLLQRMFSSGIPEYFSHLVVMNSKIQALAQLPYRTTRVFVTFETEKDQRHVLEKLSVGATAAAKNDGSRLPDPKYLFRGKHVLHVAEAKEPNTVQWQSLNVSFVQKIRQRVFSTVVTALSIYAVTLAIRRINKLSTAGTALTISAFNKLFPFFAKAVMSIEQHSNEGSLQKSLYFKIAAFRWINTVVVISLITPFTSFIGETGLIPQIYAVFFSEIVTLSVVQLCDFGGHIQRHLRAPRAKNQDAMNLCFDGEDLDIAERYTNMTKMVFLTLWYSAIYPASFFLCSVAMFINYFIDRFSFMRTWKRTARLGAEISIFSRRYFFGIANVVMAVMSSFYWSAFPYDNLCDTGEVVGSIDRDYIGNFALSPKLPTAWIAELLGGDDDETEDLENVFNVTIDLAQPIYTYCKQDFLSPGFGFTFPFLPSEQEGRGGEWMTPTQMQITTVFGWSSLAVVLLVMLRIAHAILKGWYWKYRGKFQPVGEDQNIRFSDVPHISSYIPEVGSRLFPYPLLVCDIDTFDEGLIEWEDPSRPYSFYDLTKDAETLMKGSNFSKKHCFSQVKTWNNDN